MLSLQQACGSPARPIVGVGDHVLRGEPIAEPAGFGGTAVHASTSGHVVAIEPRLVPSFTSVATAPCIVIEADGESRPFANAPDPWPRERAKRLERIAAGGIVGLGGAAFPTAAKLDTGDCHTLVVNGAECEPYISCDDMLMRTCAVEVVGGTAIMAAVTGTSSSIIAIERDKPQAIEAINAALTERADDSIRLAEVPSIYPAGGERQLIDVLAGVEIPGTAYPSELGFVCQNVGTAAAIYRLACTGEPLVTRIVTVTGDGVAKPCNIEAPIGTAISEIVEYCGGYTARAARLIHGGSMMGYTLPEDSLPVTKSTNCLIVASEEELRSTYHEWPCIRCGECGIVCPVRLMPQDLLVESKSSDVSSLEDMGLIDCIECGCCDVVCPSQIPLTEIFRTAKYTLAAWHRQQSFSAESEQRYQRRQQREREDAEREQEAQAVLQRRILEPDARQQAIAAAVERARRKRSVGSEADADSGNASRPGTDSAGDESES